MKQSNRILIYNIKNTKCEKAITHKKQVIKKVKESLVNKIYIYVSHKFCYVTSTNIPESLLIAT